MQILKTLIKKGKFETEKDIREALPELSKKGSKDDMSIAMLYDEKKLRNMYKIFLQWQIDNLSRHIDEQNQKISEANKIQENLESIDSPTKQNLIDLQYANKDYDRAIDERSRLQERLTTLKEELAGF